MASRPAPGTLLLLRGQFPFFRHSRQRLTAIAPSGVTIAWSSYHAVNSIAARSPRGALVGDDGRRPSPLLSLPAPLPHRRRPARLLLHPQERRRTAGAAWLRTARGARDGSRREEAAEPFLPRNEDPLHGHRRLQHGLLLLPELGHLEGQVRSGQRARSQPRGRSRGRAASIARRISPSPTTSRPSGASTSSTSRARRTPPASTP